MMPAIRLYRSRFLPSEQLTRPYVMLGINVAAADTDEQARRLFTSHQQAFVNLRRGTPGPLPPPNEEFSDRLSADQKLELDQTLSVTAVGSSDAVRAGLDELVARTGADE